MWTQHGAGRQPAVLRLFDVHSFSISQVMRKNRTNQGRGSHTDTRMHTHAHAPTSCLWADRYGQVNGPRGGFRPHCPPATTLHSRFRPESPGPLPLGGSQDRTQQHAEQLEMIGASQKVPFSRQPARVLSSYPYSYLL